MVFEASPPLLGPDGKNATGSELSPDVSEAILFLFCEMLENQSKHIFKHWLYGLRENWLELQKLRLRRKLLRLIAVTRSGFITNVLNVIR